MAQSLSLILNALFVIYAVIAIKVLYKDKNSWINKTFFVLCIFLSIWALGYGFMITAPNIYRANLWRIVAALGWCFFHSAWLIFALAIKHGDRVRLTAVKIMLIYAPSILFYINTLGCSVNKVLLRVGDGWADLYPTVIFRNLFIIYYLTFGLTGIFIIYKWGKDSAKKREKKQSQIIVSTSLCTLVIGSILDVVMPIIGVNFFPVAVITVSISMVGVLYAISKYKMMGITPQYVLDYIFKVVNNPIIFMSEEFVIKNVNKVALTMTEYSFEEFVEKHLNTLITDYNFCASSLTKEKCVKKETKLVGKNGNTIECMLYGEVVYDGFGDVLGIVIILHDISEHKKVEKFLTNYSLELENKIKERTMKLEIANQSLMKEISDRNIAEEKIRYLGYHDELTGLPNRRYFNGYLLDLIAKVKGTEQKFAVMYLDLDNFKLVNDEFGHQSGDVLLKYFSACISKVIKENYVLTRIGGDEFLILVTDLAEKDYEDTINMLSSELVDTLKEPFLIENKENFITISMGVSCYPEDGVDGETLIKNADIAMYEAKKCGKNNIKICSPEIKAKVAEKNKYRNSIYRAIEKDELKVYYQPQVDIKCNKIVGFEALLRWKVNNQYFVSPKEFIPLAEELGVIVPMGYWVIRTSCEALKEWHNMGLSNLRMAINLSINQLNEKNFVDSVLNIIEDARLDPSFIEFEVTERITLKGNEEAKKRLEQLKRIGVKISIDDFGTDYSSFMNLKSLPIDKIKIAMEFIQEVNENEKDATIVSSIIELSHNLGLEVIAEGVETKEQLQYLKDKKCDVIQGYLYYKPMPYAEIEEILFNRDMMY